jgi:hypothetical protein
LRLWIFFRTKTFEGLAFQPFPDFSRFTRIAKKSSLGERLAEERRLKELEEETINTLEQD